MPERASRSFQTQAIVLRHQDFGEADRLLTVFTLKKGKIKVLAKGVKRIRSHKAGHLEPFAYVQLLIAHARDLPLITQAETIHPFTVLRDNLQLTAFAAYACELVERFSYEEEENRALFRLLADTLDRLEKNDHPQTVMHYYAVRLLDLTGYRPQLFACVGCGDEIQAQDQFFSPLEGGAICPKCAPKYPSAWRVSMRVLKYLRHLQRSSFAQVQALDLPDDVENGLGELIERYLTYLLERGLNTAHFLREIQAGYGE